MDPDISSARWSRWTVKGTESVITRVLEGLDATPLHAWKRSRGEEVQAYQPPVRPGSACYSLDTTPTHAGVILWLDRIRDSELRGGRVFFAGPPYPASKPTIPATWNQIMRFLDEAIVPAALAAGAEVRAPTFEDMFILDLPYEISDRLQQFSKLARKTIPLNREEAELWRGFVVESFRVRPIIDDRGFTAWLGREGWTKEATTELKLRFADEFLLLSRYADEVSAA